MELPVRKIVRLQNFDYSSTNSYFLTICTHEKHCIFGRVSQLNLLGQIAEEDLLQIPDHYQGVRIDHCVVMPNHVHAILSLEGETVKHPTIQQIVSLYKAGVSRKIRKRDPKRIVWQRSFYEHVIRNQNDYDMIWNYIENNPVKWEMDRFYRTDVK